MLKNKSLERTRFNDEMFTDLTPKEASVMVGGAATILLNRLDYSTTSATPDVAGMRVLLDGNVEASCDIDPGNTGAICLINQTHSFLGDLSVQVDEFVDSLNTWNTVISVKIGLAADSGDKFFGTSGITSSEYTLKYQLIA